MTTAQQTAESQTIESVTVYEAPLRLWHWINALSIIILAITGYLIGSPLPSIGGEASDHYMMGYIRFAHFASAYVFFIGFLARIYWAFVGNYHAKQLFMLPVRDKNWWQEVLFEARWYLFLEKAPKKYIGHNPLAQLFMFFMMTLGSIFMIATGFALYGDGTGDGSWAESIFGWVIPMFGQSQDVHTWHHLGMWYIITFVIMHVYVAVREDIMSRQSIISTMVSGERMFKDNRPD